MVTEILYFSAETTWEHETPSPAGVIWIDPSRLVHLIMEDAVYARRSINMAERLEKAGFERKMPKPLEKAGLISDIERYENRYDEILQGALPTAKKLNKLLPNGGGDAWLVHINSSIPQDKDPAQTS